MAKSLPQQLKVAKSLSANIAIVAVVVIVVTLTPPMPPLLGILLQLLQLLSLLSLRYYRLSRCSLLPEVSLLPSLANNFGRSLAATLRKLMRPLWIHGKCKSFTKPFKPQCSQQQNKVNNQASY